MGHETATITNVDSMLPTDADAGMYMLKESLDTDEVAFTVYQMEPGAEGISHDHSEEGQEEVYYVVEGGVDVDFGSETVSLEKREAIRVDPADERQIRNRDHYSELVLVGAPR